MSIEASAWAWEQKRCGKGKLRGNAKLVLLALADHADELGVCWPGRRGIAAKVGISRPTVTRLLAQLETGGLVKREPRFEGEGRQTSTRYVLPIAHPPAQKRAPGLRSSADAPCSPARTQEPPLEPSFEKGVPPGNVTSLKQRRGRPRYDQALQR